MKFLKNKITRSVAFAAACIIVAACAFSAVKTLTKYDVIYDNDDYLCGETYDSEINSLFGQLWTIGNMYLRNLDENGEFSGSKELEKSTKKALQDLALMNSNGEIIIDNYNNFNYTVSWNDKNEITNTESELELDSIYSLTQEKGQLTCIPQTLDWVPNNLYWYSTNYGMYYYFFSDTMSTPAAAVFDYDTADLNCYVDDSGVEIYYKTDGSTPVPEDFESYDLSGYNYYVDGTYEYVSENGNTFSHTKGQEYSLQICITPTESLIAAHEEYEAVYDAELNGFVHSLGVLVPFLAAALVLTIYFLIAGGYSVDERKFVLGKFNRIFTEVPLIIGIASIGIGLAMISLLQDFESFFEKYFNFIAFAAFYAIIYGILFAAIGISFNTLIIKLKCRSFWKTSLLGRIWIAFVKYAKKICRKIKSSIVSREMIQNDIFIRRFVFRSAIAFLVGATAVIFGISLYSYGFIIFTAIIIIAFYLILSIRDLKELTKLGKHISDMNSGDYSKHEVEESSVIYGMTEKLNNISDGMQEAVERQIKSERMKIDLVTNVSHDLKTPLTSIIGYINLLSMEELTPEARDYVKILEQRSERLKIMVFDLFDLAKATSGTDIHSENIDAVVLVNQILGDMADKINKFGKEIRVETKIKSAPVFAEGKKLYRVMQNLIDNALKYSLDETRIYIQIYEENSNVIIKIKNIASYEMKFTPDEIIERFVRGDESRSSEGNGLGLSIAKTFTEACGGTFNIIIDGDAFIAEVKFPILSSKKD